ncbi:GH23903 [Drosophila grimshawi]|uniref:GH23903 n=1 Tax=Drosophila grimshawi TaxID=7222 RepID=B4K0V9_DROGR|nr:GH23903 [Drosophila grimshawi]
MTRISGHLLWTFIYGGFSNTCLSTYSSVDFDSDHLPVHIELAAKGLFAQAGLRRRILPSNANISKFQAYLNQRVLLNTEINSGEDIEDAIDVLNSNIYEAAKYASPPHLWQKQHSNASVKKTSLDDQTRKLLQLKREFLVLRTSSARQRYRQVQNRLRKALRLLKVNYLNNLFKQIDVHDRYRMQKLWRLTQTLKRQVEPNWPFKMHSVDGTQTWTRTNSEKAEEFVHHLEARFMPNYLNTEEDRRKVAGELQLLQQQQQQRIAGDGGAFGTSLPFRPVTLSEVTLEIKALVLKKSPGLDNIDNHVIKVLPQKAILYLVLLFNSIQQLARVTQFILGAYEKRQYCSAVFIDISEAFDRVWHEGLLYKLIRLLPPTLYGVLRSYLSNRSFVVNTGADPNSATGSYSDKL